MEKQAIYSKNGAIATITLNRPEKRNPLSNALRSELFAALERIDQDPTLRVTILRGAGGHFSAGYDLKQNSAENQPFSTPGGLGNWPRHVVDGFFRMNDLAKPVIAAVEGQLLGRRAAVEMALACILADGHLLIEDAPGSGKTSLSAALAAALGLEFQRVQCTNDLLPADITGLSIFDRDSGSFSLREGPVFTQMLLADELNRAPSKTQSALLQAMEERAVTIDRETRPLPRPSPRRAPRSRRGPRGRRRRRPR